MSGPDAARGGHSESADILRIILEDRIGFGYSARTPPTERTWWGRLAAVLVVALLVASSIWSAEELQRARRGAASVNQALRGEVAVRTQQQDELESQVFELDAAVTQSRAALLDDGEGLIETSTALGARIGAVPVTGPGIVITLDDGGATSEDSQVHDFDLQVLVNALWASGAEAIAVNGQRLSATTAIRTAGAAILVNLVPVAGPYQIEAIGDPSDLQVQLARTRAAGHLAVLRDTYGVDTGIGTSESLTLGSVQPTSTHWAQPLPAPEGNTRVE